MLMLRARISLTILALLFSTLLLAQKKDFSQEGQASYYADKFHGRSTASGEKYDKTLFTCAHMTLPYGTNLKVTNLENGKSVVVRVNDRGPFSPNRIIDLSKAAAETLDMITKGLAKVRIEITSATPPSASTTTVQQKKEADVKKSDAQQGIVAHAPSLELNSKPLPRIELPEPPEVSVEPAKTELYSIQINKKTASGFAVQLASFNGVGNLMARLADFDSSVKKELNVLAVEKEGNLSYKILYGIYSTKAEAEKAKEGLVGKFSDCFIISL
ncbi:MAG: septal ring lytic transglycosylase RlpA family protein [Bacteroides sp.]